MKMLKYGLFVLLVAQASIFAKGSHLFNALLDEEDEDNLVQEQSNSSKTQEFLVLKQDEGEKEFEQLPISHDSKLLSVLLDDSVAIESVFPSKTEKYYRGQIEKEGFEYLDNSRYDTAITPEMIASMTVDPKNLTAAEKENLDAYYRLIQQKYESPWYMKYISKKVGYGIFAAADIKKGQLISEYVGIIYDKKTYLNKLPYNANYCWSMIPHSSITTEVQFYVDAIKSCNFTRFINHSYKPNVTPLAIYTPEGYRMLYVACEDIAKDEQLLVNYGNGYWSHRNDHQELSR